jgi:hypothetical protein
MHLHGCVCYIHAYIHTYIHTCTCRYFPLSLIPQASDIKRAEERYIRYLYDNDVTRDCFFSYTYDLTLTLQTNMGGSPRTLGPGAHCAQDMFTWNKSLLEGGGFITSLKDIRWATSLVHGFFEQRSVMLLSRRVVLTLIARRSWRFAGTRYLRRGVTFGETKELWTTSGLLECVCVCVCLSVCVCICNLW